MVELLRDCLNGYGHQYLDDDDRVRFNWTAASTEEAVERGRSAARALPRAQRLSRLLYEHAERVAKEYKIDAQDDVVETTSPSSGWSPAPLWLTGDIGCR